MGANWLRQWFGDAVTEPVRLHVPAKRYLCAVDAGYLGLLSAELVRTLSLQGGPMTAAEVAAFEALPFSRDAVAVRRWTTRPRTRRSPHRGSRTSRRYFLRPWSEADSVRPGGRPPDSPRARVRDSALTAVELCTLNATALPR